LNAAGSQVEFCDVVDGSEDGASIVFIDQATRRALSPASMETLTRLVVIGDSLEDADVVEMLRLRGVSHVISDADDPDDTELVVTSVKLLSGDLFGLEKYLSWGVKVVDRSISTYEDKREALVAVTSQAREAGARRPLIARIESVVDELLMNAMYDAPAAARGEQHGVRLEPEGDAKALLRWASDGRYFAVSVQDDYGELHKETILDHLVRARAERGKPRSSDETGGAGLGLYFILSSVTRFIANIEPGKRTEVVCLFDLKQTGRDADACARSLHVFGR
jgi:anti-sigma regulatory factor (Ser/Thr protein kinase)